MLKKSTTNFFMYLFSYFLNLYLGESNKILLARYSLKLEFSIKKEPHILLIIFSQFQRALRDSKTIFFCTIFTFKLVKCLHQSDYSDFWIYFSHINALQEPHKFIQFPLYLILCSAH